MNINLSHQKLFYFKRKKNCFNELLKTNKIPFILKDRCRSCLSFVIIR